MILVQKKENLQQIICNTAKEWFEISNDEMNLFGLSYTKDEQISIWVNRPEETWKKCFSPGHSKGTWNETKAQFNFLRSLDISNINAEVVNLHPYSRILGRRKHQKRVY